MKSKMSFVNRVLFLADVQMSLGGMRKREGERERERERDRGKTTTKNPLALLYFRLQLPPPPLLEEIKGDISRGNFFILPS